MILDSGLLLLGHPVYQLWKKSLLSDHATPELNGFWHQSKRDS